MTGSPRPQRKNPTELRARQLPFLDPRSIAHPAVRQAVEFIHAHCSSPDLDMEGIADAAKLSRNYLIVLFRAATGLTPHNYLMTCRIRHAVEWIDQNPQKNIAAAAYSSGFRSLRTFESWFRRLLRVTAIEHVADVRRWRTAAPPPR